ncbi:peptide deformylase, mitochondrial isoform X3 [Drosophila sechellia]|uniref:peptide deformylase, mitochondrial isoform X3 n=1 Tax=Drosophila sechellia TaxID=7238 RepID=UPI0013DE0E0E|nr:peptide deformylase, mitochondrial isoform X3 [Drosophila sechellia]
MHLKPRIKVCQTMLRHSRSFGTSPPASQSFRKWYQQLWTTERTNLPPYNHFTQIGDPVLRQQAALVPKEHMDSPEIKAIVERMVKVLRKFDCVGIAAPQIGVSLRIIAMEFKGRIRKELPEAVYQARQMSELPLTVRLGFLSIPS